MVYLLLTELFLSKKVPRGGTRCAEVSFFDQFASIFASILPQFDASIFENLGLASMITYFCWFVDRLLGHQIF